MTPQFFTLQSAKARGAVSTAWTSTGVNLPASSLIMVIPFYSGFTSGAIGGANIRCTSTGLTLTQRQSTASSTTWMYGASIFTTTTTGATTGTQFTFDLWNGSLQTVNDWWVLIIAFPGYDTTTPVAGGVSGTDADGKGAGSLTLGATPVAADYVVGVTIGLCNTVGSITVTQGSGFTEQCDDYSDDSAHIEVEYVTGTTSTAVTWVELGTPSTVALEARMMGIIVKAAAGGGSSYSVSATESGTASDALSQVRSTQATQAESGTASELSTATGGNGVAVLESGTAADAPGAIGTLAASYAEAMSGSDVVSLPSAVPVVTLKQYWLKNYQTTTQAALQSGYSNPITIAGGSALIALWAGWDATRQIPLPTINTGGPLASFTDAGSTSSSLHPNQMTQAMAGVANLSAGSYTVSVPNILDPDSTGSQGELGVWVLEVTNLGTSFTVVDVSAAHRTSSSLSWSASTDTTPQARDLVLIMGTLENSVAATSSGVAGPAGFTQIALNDDGTNFIPTQLAYKVLTAGGAVTATWTATDPNKTEDFGMVVVLRPVQTSSTTASVTESGTGTDAPSAVLATTQAVAESGTSADAPSAVRVTSASASEAGTASDAPTAGTSTSAAATESGTASDASSAGTSTSAAATEAGTAADAPAATAASPQAVTEAGTTVDAPSAVQAASVATAEAGTAADATSTSGAVTSGAVAEAGTASEAPSAVVATPAALSEAGTSSDAPAASLSASGALAEAGAAVDAPAAAAATGAAVVEAGTAVDAVSQISGAILAILEALAAQDTPAARASWSPAMVEALVASDVPVSIATMAVAVVEAGVSADFIAQGATISAAVIEAGVVADAVSALRAVGDGVGEILLAADATGLSAVFVALAADSGNAADIAQATMVLATAMAEVAAAQDATDGQAGSGTSLSDTLAATDFVDWLEVAFTLLRGFAFPADSRTMEFPADVRTFDFPAAARSFDFPSDGRGHDFPETGQ